MTIFSWLVSETGKNPGIDYYIIFRFAPEISRKLNLFTQNEPLNTFPKYSGTYNFIQQFRPELKMQFIQLKLGMDL